MVGCRVVVRLVASCLRLVLVVGWNWLVLAASCLRLVLVAGWNWLVPVVGLELAGAGG